MSFIRAGLSMLLFIFLAVIIYFVISAPMTAMFDAFDDADAGEATDEMNSFLPNIRSALNMFFAVLIAIPITGFVIWVFRREPDWMFRRYY
jgi:ABC-type polysaccharide/polyol phosphate export permease